MANKKFFIGNTLITETDAPRCKECGEELSYHHKKSNVYVIDGCINKNCPANGGGRKRYWSIFGKEEYGRRKKKFNETRVTTLAYWIKSGYSEEEAKRILSENQSRISKQKKTHCAPTKETMLKKLGDEESVKKFFKERSHLCAEYWIKRGYSETAAKEIISKAQSKYSKLQKPSDHKNWTQFKYWMMLGYSEEDAKKKVSEKQRTFTKEKCIEKYGKERGLEIWADRQKRWQKKLHDSQHLHVGYSKVSQELFNLILEKYKKEQRDYVFFGEHNHEYSLMEGKKLYIYDFTDLNQRKIIEFNGDIYHGNPEIFNETDTPNPFKPDKTCKDLWDFDNEKKKAALKNNFQELIIWEKDFRENKDKILNNCLKFLNL